MDNTTPTEQNEEEVRQALRERTAALVTKLTEERKMDARGISLVVHLDLAEADDEQLVTVSMGQLRQLLHADPEVVREAAARKLAQGGEKS